MSVSPLYDAPELRDRVHVFRDRNAAGERLATLLAETNVGAGTVCAIPAGGLPVALPIAERLELPLAIAVVSKITPPFNTEIGYGAVAFDGSVLFNHRLVESLGLSQDDIDRGLERTREKVAARIARLAAGRTPDVAGRTAIVVDDGLASGFTLRAAIAALRSAGAERLVVAVPTAHDLSALALAHEVDALVVANVRRGTSFAVADAYERWSDVSDEQALELLAGFTSRRASFSRSRP